MFFMKLSSVKSKLMMLSQHLRYPFWLFCMTISVFPVVREKPVLNKERLCVHRIKALSLKLSAKRKEPFGPGAILRIIWFASGKNPTFLCL